MAITNFDSGQISIAANLAATEAYHLQPGHAATPGLEYVPFSFGGAGIKVVEGKGLGDLTISASVSAQSVGASPTLKYKDGSPPDNVNDGTNIPWTVGPQWSGGNNYGTVSWSSGEVDDADEGRYYWIDSAATNITTGTARVQYDYTQNLGFVSTPPATLVFTNGHTIAPVTLPAGEHGGGTYTYTLSPLPAGLSFDPATRIISGTPTTVGTTNAVYTVSDGTYTETATIAITVSNPHQASLTITGGNKNIVKGNKVSLEAEVSGNLNPDLSGLTYAWTAPQGSFDGSGKSVNYDSSGVTNDAITVRCQSTLPAKSNPTITGLSLNALSELGIEGIELNIYLTSIAAVQANANTIIFDNVANTGSMESGSDNNLPGSINVYRIRWDNTSDDNDLVLNNNGAGNIGNYFTNNPSKAVFVLFEDGTYAQLTTLENQGNAFARFHVADADIVAKMDALTGTSKLLIGVGDRDSVGFAAEVATGETTIGILPTGEYGMNRLTGKALAGKEHLIQSLITLLSTPLGSRVMLPEYGCGITDLVDSPITDTGKMQMRKTIFEAVTRWEPRIKIQQISAISRDVEGELTITIEGIYQENPETLTIQPFAAN